MKKNLLLVALLSAIAAPAFAADNGVYVVGSVGSTSNVSSTASGTSFSGLLGYQFDKNWGAEAGYVSLLNGAPVDTGTAGVTGKATLSGAEVAGVYTFPVSQQFSVIARLGYASMTAKADATSLGITLSTSATLSGTTYGLGVQYNLNEQFSIRAGLNGYNLKDNSGASGETPNNVYVAVAYKF
jgi:OOP family OmpA-OmpF porin